MSEPDVSAPDIAEPELAELLRRTGHAHHAAYAATNGADPEWALWYAGYLQAHLDTRLGRVLTRSELTYLLIDAERSHTASGADRPWPEHYAARILGGAAEERRG